MSDARWLEDLIHEQIPITANMGLRVAHYDGHSIRISAPLEPNTNHKCTAFGGSLASVLTVAGWGLLRVKLRDLELDADLVIHKSEFIYNEPVQDDFSAYCDLPPDDQWQRFTNNLTRRGLSRIVMTSWIAAPEHAAVTMEGRFVAILRK